MKDGLRRAARAAFGSWSWQPPAWARWSAGRVSGAAGWTGRHRRASALAIAAGIAIAAAGYAGWRWYDAQPKPVAASFSVELPGRTEIENKDAKPNPVRILFSLPVAPLAAVDKPVAQGISISPPIAGKWSWEADRALVFEPKDDWPVGAEYRVDFERKLFVSNVRLAQYRAQFQTAPFVAKLEEARFYQDPVDPNGRRVSATLAFTHPVDAAELEKRLALRQEGETGRLFGLGAGRTPFRVTYDKLKLHAYLLSEPLEIPPRDTRMDVLVDAGVRAQRGGPATREKLAQSVTMPGINSLRVNAGSLGLVNNERMEPEQILYLGTSASVDEREMAKSVTAWVLPVYHPDIKPEERKQPTAWSDPAQVGAAVLKDAEPLRLDPIPGEREHNEVHSFKYKATPGRYVYVHTAKGLRSFGGYVLGEHHDRIFRVPAYPMELKFMSAGSLLSMSGEKKLPVLARDIDAVRFTLGRVLPQQVQHLVTQSQGNFSDPRFLENFDETYVTERFELVVQLPRKEPGTPQYHALDLSKYLDTDAANRRGVFVLTAESWDAAKKRPTGKRDRRLVVVTDLGIVVKRSLDGSHDVFVQSIATGEAVSGASVDLLGRNGLAVTSQATDASGRAALASTKGFTNERTPALFLVRRGGDYSFLPIGRSDRDLDFSRFDVGGVVESADAGRLNAFLFSDRGIYRPGDEIHVGLIVKAKEWSRAPSGVPLEVEVTDPRGLVVKKEKLRLGAAGFEEIRHATQDSSPTGIYTVSLFVVKDGARAAQLGSTTVKVQEFLPDRMKMSARLSSESPEGWVSPADLKARVMLQNLFGTPAENRRVAAVMRLAPAYPAFAAWRDYVFYDPRRPKEPSEEKLAPATTNAQGEAEFDLNLQRFADATYRVSFVAEGFEAGGGRGVAAETAQLVSSMPYLVGYKADGDLAYVSKGGARNVSFIAIDPRAKKTAVGGLSLAWIERKYVSVLTKQENGTFKYESRKRETALADKPLDIGAQGLTVPLDTSRAGQFALVVKDAKGAELARVEYGVAGQGNVARALDRNAELQLTLDKSDYERGEEIQVSVQAPYAGSGLITIERDKVYAHAWFKASTTGSVQKIRVPKEFEGNGYVNVTFIRDPNSDEIFMSPLSYGVAPFSVSLDTRREKLSLGAPDLVKPGDIVKFKVRADRPSRVVVYAVDEGILQVAAYKTPDPLKFFFQKRQLGVRTSQILDLILPEIRHVMAYAAPGGDDAGAIGKNLNPFKRKRDKPAVYWSGVLDVDSEEKELAWTVPDTFNGALRVMAVSVAPDAVGVAQRKTTVRADLVLSPNVPTTVAPGDEFEVSVGVANTIAGSGKDAAVSVQLSTSPHLVIVGAAKQELRIGELREGSATFRLRATDKLGSATLSFVASHGAKANRLSTDLSLRPAMPYRSELVAGTVKGERDVPVTSELFAEHRKLEGSISYVPLTLAHGLAGYLSDYPHLCTEQLVSRAFPALVLANRPDFGYFKDASHPARPAEHVAALVSTLRARQNAEGGFGLYTSSLKVEPVPAVHAMLFLAEARERRYEVPEDMLKAGDNWLREFAATEGASLVDERAKAQAIYVLTRQGIVTTNLAAALQKRLDERYAKQWRNDVVAAWLGASYQLMKQERLAARTIADLRTGGTTKYELYYDPLTRDSQIVFVLARHFPERYKELGGAPLADIARPLERGFYNTIGSAYALLALDAVAQLGGAEQGAARLAMSEVLADGSVRAVALPASVVPRARFSPDAKKLRFGNPADLPAYYAVTQAGFDRAMPAKEIRDGLEIVREFVGADGKPIASVKLGDEVDVRIRIRSVDRKAVDNVAIVDLLPGGFEVVLEPKTARTPPQTKGRAPEAEEAGEAPEGEGDDEAGWKPPIGTAASTWRPDYLDIREDRIVLYGWVQGEAQQFVYRVKATNAGKYTVPPAYAEAMYERGVSARSLAASITVEAPAK